MPKFYGNGRIRNTRVLGKIRIVGEGGGGGGTEPTFNAGAGDTMLINDSFDGYATTASLHASSWDLENTSFASGTGSVQIISGSMARNGTGNAVRFNLFPGVLPDSARLARFFTEAQHVVVSWYWRFSVGADVTFGPGSTYGRASEGNKWFTLWRDTSGNPALAQRMTNGFNGVSYPSYWPSAKTQMEYHINDNEIDAELGSDLYYNQNDHSVGQANWNDGNWHRYTLEANNNNGVGVWYKMWVDGQELLNTTSNSRNCRAGNTTGYKYLTLVDVTPGGLPAGAAAYGYTHDIDDFQLWSRP